MDPRILEFGVFFGTATAEAREIGPRMAGTHIAVDVGTMRTPSLVLLLLATALASAACSSEASDASEETEGQLGAAPPFGPEPTGHAARLPIVLTHGFNASPTNVWGFYKVKEALEADGHKVVVAAVPPFQSPENRASHLAKVVDQALADFHVDKVNVVAHSMGGLDARVLISGQGYGDRIASLTTISTPHRGSNIADVALRLVPDGKVGDAIDALAGTWARRFTEDDLAKDSDLHAALEALSEKNAPAFNAKYKDDGRVYYQSWAGVSSVLGIPNPKDDDACGARVERTDTMDAQLAPNAPFVAHGLRLTPNDGMATVESSKWGHFNGCIPADHLDEVGQPRHDQRNQRTGFDHLRFYRNVAFDLARRGW
jgi:triacylglycerol lipase